MGNAKNKRSILILMGGLLVISAMALAQNQNQNQSLWQKLKNSAKQTGQNTAQQGAQQVQQQVPAVGSQMNGTQPSPCGNLTAAGGGAGGTLTNAAFNGGGSNGNYATGSCGQNCFNAGPFAAAISQMTMTQQGGWHIIRMQVQFHNASNQPIAIAYHDGSMEMTDDLGNAYQGAGGNPGEVQGMGIDRGSQTDSQFVLSPGQTSSAMFAVARYRANTSAIGSAFTYNLTIDELQAQNGAQAIVARQYNLNFPNMTPGSTGGAFPSTVPASSFAGGSGSGATGVANNASGTGAGYNAATGPAANSRTAVPAQRNAINPRTGVATTAPNGRAPVQGTVSNAALRSTAATTAKPAAAVKPVPAKTPVKKTTANNATLSK